MDESKELLKVVIAALEELRAEVRGIRTELGQQSAAIGDLRTEMDKRFDRMDERLHYLTEKWMEHDEAIYQLKRKQA